MRSRRTARERINNCQSALEVLNDGFRRLDEKPTPERALAVIQIQATLAVAETILEINDETIRKAMGPYR